MKRLIFLFALLGNCILLYSQTVNFGYDDAGNRITRSISLKSTSQGDSIYHQEQPEIKDQIGEQQISIYPNPVQSEITVKIPELEEGEYADISLYGQGGQLLYRNEKAGYNNIINFSEFPAGIYFMTITIREKSIQWKVVKE